MLLFIGIVLGVALTVACGLACLRGAARAKVAEDDARLARITRR
jgi:hypothetical protein